MSNLWSPTHKSVSLYIKFSSCELSYLLWEKPNLYSKSSFLERLYLKQKKTPATKQLCERHLPEGWFGHLFMMPESPLMESSRRRRRSATSSTNEAYATLPGGGAPGPGWIPCLFISAITASFNTWACSIILSRWLLILMKLFCA